MPVSATAILASGMRIRFAASAAALKIASTCSCVYVAYFVCAARTRASVASRSATGFSGAIPASFSIFVLLSFVSARLNLFRRTRIV